MPSVVWLGSFPLPFQPFSVTSGSCLSFVVFLCVARRAYLRGRDGGGGGSQIINQRESLVLCCRYVRYIILLGVLECQQFCCCCSVKVYEFSCIAKVYAGLLLCQSVCSLVAVSKCMQICCSAKLYALCCLVVVPKCMHYAVLLQCQSVCTMQSCCSAKVYADLLQCRRTCNFCNEECRDLSDFCGQITDDICRSEDSKYHCKRWPLFYAVAWIKSSTAFRKE